MITQYTTSYSVPSADIQALSASKVGFLDSYVLMQTGQYEYQLITQRAGTHSVNQYRFYRTSNIQNNYWQVSEVSNPSFDYHITNEYYVFTNVGAGRQLSLPIYEQVTSFSLMIISCALMFTIVFKGVFAKCLRRRKSL